MAKQCGQKFITGSIDNLCFYQMEGKYYVRTKSSLTGKRVKSDPVFAKTMDYAGLFARASKVASAVYREIPKDKRINGLYRRMTGEAMRLSQQGVFDDEITCRLREYFCKPVKNKKPCIQQKVADTDLFVQFILTPVFKGTNENRYDNKQTHKAVKRPALFYG